MVADNQGVLDSVFSLGRVLTYQKKEVIVRAGDVPSGVYLITSGWVKVYALTRSGEQNVITTLLPGEVFPLSWAVANELIDVSFAAVVRTSVCRISKEVFTNSLTTNSAFHGAILAMAMQHCSRLTSELYNHGYRSARQRLAFRIVTLVQMFGRYSDPTTVSIDFPITSDFFARSTNMTRETASREFHYFIRKKLLTYKNGRLAVLDLPALRYEIDDPDMVWQQAIGLLGHQSRRLLP